MEAVTTTIMNSSRAILGFHLIAAFALSPLTAGAQQTADSRTAGFDEYVAKAVKDWKVTGLAIAVVKDGKVAFAKGYGVREHGKPAPVDTQTVFAIASTTKAITAAALGMLVDEGRMKWDDPVTRHLPSLELHDPYVTRELTVRDLLTHRGGLANADWLWDVADFPMREIMARVRHVKPSYSLRSSFVYHNVMYMIAGEVVAAASGMTWEKFVSARIFAPLGMRHTVASLSQLPAGANAASPHYLYGGDTIAVVRNSDSRAVGSAGGVWSNVADMSRWMLFLLDSARVNGERLLKPATWAELFKPQVVVPEDEWYVSGRLTKPHWTTYGLGWFQQDYHGRMLSFHTGSLSGMVAIAGLVPDERFGVFVLANVDHAEIRHALMYRAIDTWVGNPSRDWSADFRSLYAARRARNDSVRGASDAKRIKGTRPSLALAKYVGVYEDPLLGRVTVTERGGRLRVELGPDYQGPLEHWQYDRFRVRYDYRWQGSDMITFTIGDGVASAMEVAGFTLRRVPAASTKESR